jgi:hypothetical protein
MEPSSLYPQDFLTLIDGQDSVAQRYKELLCKCKAKSISDLFVCVHRLIEDEDQPDDLERIRMGINYLEGKFPQILLQKEFRIVSALKFLVPEKLSRGAEDVACEGLHALQREAEEKMLSLIEPAMQDLEALRVRVQDQIAQNKSAIIDDNPEMRIFLNHLPFCRDARAFILRFSYLGRGRAKEQATLLVEGIEQLIVRHGELVGKRLDELSPIYLTAEQELDLIESLMIAGESFLHLFVVQLQKIISDPGYPVHGKEEFYLMTVCYAASRLSGVQLL